MTTLFDTSALFAVLKPDDAHHRWSVEQLEARKADGPVVIIDVVFSELSVNMTKEEIQAAITYLAVDRLPVTTRLYSERARRSVYTRSERA